MRPAISIFALSAFTLGLAISSTSRADAAKATQNKAAKNAPIKIAVMNFKAPGFEAGVVDNLYGIFVSEIDSVPGYQVVSNDEIQAMLGFEAQKTMLGCDDTSCLAEIAGALGVDKLVSGKVGKVGKTFVINITLINQKTARVEKRLLRTVKGEDDVLIQAIMDAAHELVGQKSPGPQAQATSPKTDGQSQVATTKATQPKSATTKTAVKDGTQNAEGGSMLPMILAVSGGVAVLAGAGLGGISALRYKDYKAATSQQDAHTIAEELPIWWIGSGLAGGLGMLVAGAGAVLMMTGEEE